MGRKSLNRTYKELLELRRVAANEYYKNNKDVISEKRKIKYQKLKNDSIKQNIP